MDQGHNKGIISQLSLYLSCPCNILTTMMASRPTTTKCLIILPQNVGQGQNLQKSLYLSYYTTDFYRTFVEIMAMWLATKMSH